MSVSDDRVVGKIVLTDPDLDKEEPYTAGDIERAYNNRGVRSDGSFRPPPYGVYPADGNGD